MIPAARIVHRTSTRLRLKVPAMRGDHVYFAELVEALGSLPGIDEVVVNPRTASALIRRAGVSAEQLRAFGQQHQLFEVVEPQVSVAEFTRPFAVRAQDGLGSIDAMLREATAGSADLRSAVLIVLVLLAARALFSGKAMAPAASLLWYAFTMAMPPRSPD